MFCDITHLVLEVAFCAIRSPLVSLGDVFSKPWLFCKFSIWRTFSLVEWGRKTGNEQCSLPCHLSTLHHLLLAFISSLFFLSLGNFLKALVFALSISHKPQLVLGPHLSGMIPPGLGHFFVCVFDYMPPPPPFFSNGMILYHDYFYLAASSLPPNWALFPLRAFVWLWDLTSCFFGFSPDPL